jgi:hypothetical protein
MRGMVHLLDTVVVLANDGLKQLDSATDPYKV